MLWSYNGIRRQRAAQSLWKSNTLPDSLFSASCCRYGWCSAHQIGCAILLIGETGIAVLAAMWFEINALILALCILAFLAHEITSSLDIHYASHRRLITAGEQRIHDFLTAIPFAVLLIVCVINPGQFAALFGAGSETADFTLRFKAQPLPTWYLAAWLALSPINGLLYLEEFIRCVRARRHAPSAPF